MLREEYKHIYINQEAGTSIMRERERDDCVTSDSISKCHTETLCSLSGESLRASFTDKLEIPIIDS